MKMDATAERKLIVTEPDKDPNIYIGMAETEFTTRFNNHKLSFKHKKHANKTML